MKNIKLSVIVPIYNAEKYVRKAIDSLINQSYKNLEIILINDGSTDKSFSICKEYGEKDSRIVLINQDNIGVSETRNKGLSIAKGDYITFIDSDDYLEIEAYEKCLKIIEKEKLDILKFGYYFDSELTKEKYNFSVMTNNKVLKKDYNDKIYNQFLISEDFSCVWNMIFKKDILNNIVFDKTIKYGEDLLFEYELIKNSKNIYIYDEPLYYYFYNIMGASKNKDINFCIKRVKDEICVGERICHIYRKYFDFTNNARKRVFNTFSHNLKILAVKKDKAEYFKYLDEVAKLDTILLEKKDVLKQKNIFIYFYYKIMKTIKNIVTR